MWSDEPEFASSFSDIKKIARMDEEKVFIFIIKALSKKNKVPNIANRIENNALPVPGSIYGNKQPLIINNNKNI